MKKTLAAVAVLGAFAGSALAADVTVYGRVDTGIGYADSQTEFNGKTIAESDGWGMHSGQLTSSRIGVKGSEKINDDLTVGFVLESAISGDTGAGLDGFKREASVFAKTNYGTIYAGRLGSAWSDAGSAGKYAAIASVNGTGSSGLLNNSLGVLQLSETRYDNTLAYVSPKFAGFEVFASYAMGANDSENKSSTDRHAVVGMDYQAGALKAAMAVETINEASTAGDVDDMFAVHAGGQYDFGVAKVSLAGVYFDNANDFGDLVADYTAAVNEANADVKGWKDVEYLADDLSGYGVHAGVAVPVAGGTFTATAAYIEGDGMVNGEIDTEGKVYNVGVNYQYPLSKQVKVYAGAGYLVKKVEGEGFEAESQDIKVGAGMAVYF